MSTNRSPRGALIGLGVGVVVVAVAATTWWLLRDDPAPAEPSPATPTAAPTAPATGTAPETVTAAPTPDGSPALSPLTIREDGEFPPGTAMLVLTGPYGKGGGGYFRVQRFWRLGDGPVQSDPYPPREFEDGVITGVEAGPNGRLFASVCQPLQCGTEGDPPKDTLTQFYRSDDGGVSWNYTGARSGRWWIRAATDDDAFATSFEGFGRWTFVGVTTPTALAQPAEADQEAAPIVIDGQLAWRHDTLPALLSGTGMTTVRLPLPDGIQIRDALGGPDGRIAASWLVSTSEGVTRLGVFIGGRSRAFRFPSGAPEPSAWLDSNRLLVSAEVADRRAGACTTVERTGGVIGRAPAILDFDADTLSFITDPFLPNGCALGTERPLAVYAAFAQVAGTGSCLNIRKSPDPNGEFITCLKDGVLVGPGGPVSEAGGMRWSPVVTPIGQQGWGASEFLSRE